MKITRDAPPPTFRPVVITLNSIEEVAIMRAIVGATSPEGRVVTCMETTRCSDPVLDREALMPASTAFSTLFNHLSIALRT